MKIRGTTVGTTIKPEKILLKATDLTEEEKAQARANLGIGGGTDFSWKVVAETTLAENPEGVSTLGWNFDSGDITTENLKKMSEFKLLIKLPFTENIAASAFNCLVMFSDVSTGRGYVILQASNITCTGGTPETPKAITLAATIMKMDTIYYTMFRQSTTSGNPTAPSAMHKECKTTGGNLFDAKKWAFRVQLSSYPFPVGTRILLEGR